MNKTVTITEALAELKTIDSKISSTEDFLQQYSFRQGSSIDPLADEGGSDKVIPQRMQALKDLLERKVTIRSAVNNKNAETPLEVCGITRTVAEWIIWRRETFKREVMAFQKILGHVQEARRVCIEKSFTFIEGAQPSKVTEVSCFVSEAGLSDKIEQLREIESTLDGKLSMLNATTTVTI